MGQACCSASENAPEIRVSNEELSDQPTQNNNCRSEAEKQTERLDVKQKQRFYGKDGHVYSKTITKEMASSIDASIDEYKKRILSKQATIHEEIEEETISDSQSCSKLKSSKEASKKDVYDQFLDNLAEEISAKA